MNKQESISPVSDGSAAAHAPDGPAAAPVSDVSPSDSHAPSSADRILPLSKILHMKREAIYASQPIFANDGIFIPALGIILDLDPLSEDATWEEGMALAKKAGKRLPTIDEMRYIYCYKDAINKITTEHGGTPLSSAHWSSTEGNTNSAWYVNFSFGNTESNGKYFYYVARSVASF